MATLESIFNGSQKHGCSAHLYISSKDAVERARAEL